MYVGDNHGGTVSVIAVPELELIIGAQPPTEDEVARARDTATLALPGRWETASAVSSSISKFAISASSASGSPTSGRWRAWTRSTRCPCRSWARAPGGA